MEERKINLYDKLFLGLLIIIPLIPYNKILTEEINSCTFFILALLFMLYYFNKLATVKIDYLMILLFILSFVSTIISKDKIISFMDAFYLVSGILAYTIVKSIEIKKEYIYFSIFIGSLIAASIGIISCFVYSGMRLEGIFNYANASALLFAIAIVIYYSIMKNYNFGEKEKVKYFSRTGLLILMCSLFLTQSRGGLLVYILGIILTVISTKQDKGQLIIDLVISNLIAVSFSYLILKHQLLIMLLLFPIIIYFVCFNSSKKNAKKPKKYTTQIYSILGLIAGTAIIYEGFSRMKDITLNNPQLQERFVFYEDGLNLIFHNLLGIGAGSYSAYQYVYQTANYSVKYVHNGFLQIGIDFGVLPLIIFVIIAVLRFVRAYKERKLLNVNYILIIMILIHSLVDFSLSFVYIDLILFICLGIEDNYSGSKYINKKIASTIGAVLIMLSLLILCLLPGELIYNVATNLADADKVSDAYKVLSVWDGVPFKTGRYYEKSSIWAFKLYADTGNKKYLADITTNIDKAIKLSNNDPRLIETKGTISYLLKDYNHAIISFNESKQLRKFYLPVYAKLIESYRLCYDNKEISEGELKSKINNLNNEIKGLKTQLNKKAKFMKDQP